MPEKEEIMALYEITTKSRIRRLRCLKSDGPVLVEFLGAVVSAMSCNGSAFAPNC